MKEIPILFKDRLVRKILSGEKRVTRRPVLAKHVTPTFDILARNVGVQEALVELQGGIRCPFGVVGDKLWVREAWQAIHKTEDPCDVVACQTIPSSPEGWEIVYRATDSSGDDHGEKWRPSLHMPRWACRILLPTTSICIERLQEMNEGEASLEGSDSLAKFQASWDSIYRTKGNEWVNNPWVWRIEWNGLEVVK